MIKINSKEVLSGDTFIAIKGINNDGHDYIEEAIKNGASKVVVEKGLYSVDTLIVNDTNEYLINYLKDNVYEQIKDIKLIGITGTNGKTTTCFLIQQLLNKIGIKCGYIGTIGFYIIEKIKDLPNTTPSILDVYNMILKCKEEGCKYVVMEVSSHALKQKRVEGLFFDYAIFTNLTQDHLDYHYNMKNYMESKQKLFYKLKENGKAIINSDDDYKNNFLLTQNNNITYGFKEADYQIIDYNMNTNESNFLLQYQNKNIKFKTNLLGKHNLYNILTSIIVLIENDIEIDKIVELITDLEPPKGRMDIINYDTNKIIVDYAHTPDAVLKIISAVKELKPNKIITLIGCGGNRDKTKRPEMGQIATNLSDYVIFTSDNPRNENPNDILNDITSNLQTNNYEIIENRKKAIEKGIQILTNNDILLLLGKGHEDYQIIGNEKIHFDDKEIVLEVIRR